MKTEIDLLYLITNMDVIETNLNTLGGPHSIGPTKDYLYLLF